MPPGLLKGVIAIRSLHLIEALPNIVVGLPVARQANVLQCSERRCPEADECGIVFMCVAVVHKRNMHEGIVQVGTKIVRKSTMNSAAANTQLTKDIVSFLVEEEEEVTGSLMKAYFNVGRAVGSSSGWVRKFINDYEAKEPSWTLGWRIIDHFKETHDRVCDRVELKNTAKRAKLDALKERTNATLRTIEGISVAHASGIAPATRTPLSRETTAVAD